MTAQPPSWNVGAAQVDISPAEAAFLFGYPHVDRRSRGIHDPLLASAMWIDGGQSGQLFVGCDIIWVPRDLANRARGRIAAATGIAPTCVMVTATHTHSGPVTTRMLSGEQDRVVPGPDPNYLRRLEDGIVAAATLAWRQRQPAQLEFAIADGSGLGGNRRLPGGPALPEVPVIVARELDSGQPLALMAVVSMHPTVLHEDWLLTSGDFFGLARRCVQRRFASTSLPVLLHMGASGNQSPRHVVSGNTIAEATRLGELLGQSLVAALSRAQPIQPVRLESLSAAVALPLRDFPSVQQASANLRQAVDLLTRLRHQGAPAAATRTAECDWFGAAEGVTLAEAAVAGRLAAAAGGCLPAEVAVVTIGDHILVCWPGEVFVEFALELRQRHPEAWVITLANAELQGYLVTAEAVAEGGYEACNALFASPASGEILVSTSLDLIRQLAEKRSHARPGI